MDELSVCPLKIYTFTCHKNLLDEVLKEVTELEYAPNNSNLTSNLTYKNNNLLLWFDRCLEEIRAKKFTTIERFTITNCWANKTAPIHIHHQHTHPNSFLSGVFHLTTHETGALEFKIEDKWYKNDHTLTLFNTITYNTTSVLPEAGRLIIFPSSLIHKTSVLKIGESTRYSISFNAYPSGKISMGGKTNLTASVELYPKSVRDL